MFIQLQPQHLAIGELKLEFLAVESRVILMDDAMVIRTDDNDVRGVVLKGLVAVPPAVGTGFMPVPTSVALPCGVVSSHLEP